MEIDKDIEMPESKGLTKYPWAKMEPGDSILVEGEPKAQSNARMAAMSFGRYHGWQFRTRKEGDGMRIWRVL